MPEFFCKPVAYKAVCLALTYDPVIQPLQYY